MVPEAAFTEVPSIVAEVAPVIDQVSFDVEPDVIVLGVAVKVITGALEESIVTVAVPVTEPLLFVAVNV